MRGVKHALWVVLVNVALVAIPLGLLELYFRWQPGSSAALPPNALWQRFQSYVMFTTVPGDYPGWFDEFAQKSFAATVKTNALGFNDPREFDLTARYQKAPDEKVVLFTGGSAGWGLGATATDKTIAARMQYHLNTLQDHDRYTVINLAMGSWIAIQQFIGLQLWGARYDPDWVVVMDGFNDASVGCAYSQGVGNPMYSAAMRTLVHAFMFASVRPDIYRGWLENQLVRYSAAYRTLTGKKYISLDAIYDTANTEARPERRQIVPTKVGAAREMLAFYLSAEAATLKLFPDAKYIFSTQPNVNDFRGDFVDVYDHPMDSPERQQAIAKREAELEVYLKHHENNDCGVKAQAPSFAYILGNSAVRLERWAAEQTQHGRHVEYHNLGTLLPNDRDDRKPFFIDPVHLSDRGQELIGRYFAERILKVQ